MFAIGCIFAELFKLRECIRLDKESLFFEELLCFIGNFPVNYIDRFDELEENQKNYFYNLNKKHYRGCNILKYLNPKGEYNDEDIQNASDLLKGLLNWDWEKRLSAEECLYHPFLNGL
jgi:hypothetical protein